MGVRARLAGDRPCTTVGLAVSIAIEAPTPDDAPLECSLRTVVECADGRS